MGKGDSRRPTFVDERAFSSNWCRTFGHNVLASGVCSECGMKASEILDDESARLVQAPARRRAKKGQWSDE